jgi:hypothetical protein
MDHKRILIALEPILASIAIYEQINIWLRILCGISTLIVAFFVIRAHVIKHRIDKVTLKINEQKLAKMEFDYLNKFKEKKDEEKQLPLVD